MKIDFNKGYFETYPQETIIILIAILILINPNFNWVGILSIIATIFDKIQIK